MIFEMAGGIFITLKERSSTRANCTTIAIMMSMGFSIKYWAAPGA
jgi:hypothetical protein